MVFNVLTSTSLLEQKAFDNCVCGQVIHTKSVIYRVVFCAPLLQCRQYIPIAIVAVVMLFRDPGVRFAQQSVFRVWVNVGTNVLKSLNMRLVPLCTSSRFPKRAKIERTHFMCRFSCVRDVVPGLTFAEEFPIPRFVLYEVSTCFLARVSTSAKTYFVWNCPKRKFHSLFPETATLCLEPA